MSRRHNAPHCASFLLLFVGCLKFVSALGPGTITQGGNNARSASLLRHENDWSNVKDTKTEVKLQEGNAQDEADTESLTDNEHQGIGAALMKKVMSVLSHLRKTVARSTSETLFLFFLCLALEGFFVYSGWTNLVAAKMAPTAKLKTFWEENGTQLAFVLSGVGTFAIFVLFEHDWERGSYYCPYWDCTPIRMRGFNAGMDGTNRAQRLIISALCALAGSYDIIMYIQTIFPSEDATSLVPCLHPKFTLFNEADYTLRFHYLSALVQYGAVAVLALMATLMPYSLTHLAVAVLALWGVVVHLPTCLMLITNASGRGQIAIPGFTFATGAYVYLLWRLLVATEDSFLDELLSYWMGLHVYAVCRLLYVTFVKFDMFGDGRYTIAMFLGMAAVLPPSIGMMSMIWLMLTILVFNVTSFYKNRNATEENDHEEHSFDKDWYKKMMTVPDGLIYAEVSKEDLIARYNKAITAKEEELGRAPQTSEEQIAADKKKLEEFRDTMQEELASPESMAKFVFDVLKKKDKPEALDLNELTELLVSWGVPSYTARLIQLKDPKEPDEEVTLEDFKNHRLGKMIYTFGTHIAKTNEAVQLRV